MTKTEKNGYILYPPRSGEVRVDTLDGYMLMEYGGYLRTLKSLYEEMMNTPFKYRTRLACGYSESALSISSIVKVDDGWIITTSSQRGDER